MQVWMRVCATVAVVLALSGAARAQEDLEHGKNAPQLFASDCGICHKSAQALVKDGYPTEAFLREHYTSSREMASALFTYLRGLARPDATSSGPKRSKPKANAQKQGEGKPPRKAAKSEGKSEKPEAKPPESASGAKAEEAKTPEKKDQPGDKKE